MQFVVGNLISDRRFGAEKSLSRKIDFLVEREKKLD